MKRISHLEKGAVPGANLGAGFTASIAEKSLIVRGNYLDHFLIAYKGDLDAGASVALESAINEINPFIYRSDDIITQLNGRDIGALNVAWFRSGLYGFEGAAGEDDKVYGMKIPVWDDLTKQRARSYAVTFSGVASVSTGIVSVAAVTYDEVKQPNRLYIVEKTYTTSGTAGIETAVEDLPRVGTLLGLLVFSTTVPTATADTASVQRMFIDVGPETSAIEASWPELHNGLNLGGILTNWPADWLNNYGFIDFRDEPIDLIANKVRIRIDNQATSSITRYIPIIARAD